MCQISKYSNVRLHIYYWLNDCSPLLPTNLCVETFTLNVIVLGSVILGKLICHELEPSWMGFSSVQFSHSIMSNSLRPHESQHTRPPKLPIIVELGTDARSQPLPSVWVRSNTPLHPPVLTTTYRLKPLSFVLVPNSNLLECHVFLTSSKANGHTIFL